MPARIGIRREDKSEWERRVPIIPSDMADLIVEASIAFDVEPSPIRAFSDEAFKSAGATVRKGLEGCGVVFAVKEIPRRLLRPGVVYVYFSHTVKGQPYNMEMLRRLQELKCTLIDYERVVDAKNRRLIFFGRHAGLAGMIDTMWSLGRRLAWEGMADNPFITMRQTHAYGDLKQARRQISDGPGRRLREEGLPETLSPLVVGFAGYGNVSSGAQEILDLFPLEVLAPEDLGSFIEKGRFHRKKIYKTVFREEHLVRPKDDKRSFDLNEYYSHPERYLSSFHAFLPHLSVLMNCIYWDTRYPRLVTKQALRSLYGAASTPRLRIVGDISCDIGGAVECTLKATQPDRPAYVYDVEKDRALDGVEGRGPVVMAVDNLPCELPIEASQDFSRALKPFIPAIAAADYEKPFQALDLPAPIKRAVILHQGEFTPDYRFMEKFLEG